MKTILKILLAPICLFSTCIHQLGVPGTYVHHAQNPYSVADDTVTIDRDFHVVWRTTYRRTGGQPQHQVKIYTGSWDNDKQVVTLAENGLVLQFRKDQLLIANSQYRKL
jgi:hypothetical protein